MPYRYTQLPAGWTMCFLHWQQSAFTVSISVGLSEDLILVLTAPKLFCGPEGLIMVFLPSACFRHSNPSDRCAAFVFVCNERCLQPRCVILWVPCFSIKEESGFFFWIAWERLPLNYTDSCLTPRRNNKQDCHLTEGMLILQLLYMKVWLLLLKEDTCADFSTWPLYMPAADIRRDDCRAQAAFHGAASSVALMSMLS